MSDNSNNTYYSEAKRPLLTQEQRDEKYGWISKKYAIVLAKLAGQDVEIPED